MAALQDIMLQVLQIGMLQLSRSSHGLGVVSCHLVEAGHALQGRHLMLDPFGIDHDMEGAKVARMTGQVLGGLGENLVQYFVVAQLEFGKVGINEADAFRAQGDEWSVVMVSGTATRLPGAAFFVFFVLKATTEGIPEDFVGFWVSLAVAVVVSLLTQKSVPPKPLTDADGEPMDLNDRLGTLPVFRSTDR